MEYDNDRPIRPNYRIEIFYWGLLIAINPLVNSLTTFFYDPGIWWVLFIINLIVFPAYLLYANFAGPMLLFRRRYLFFTLLSFLFFLAMLAFLFAVYSLILKFDLSAYEKFYFTYNKSTITRECLWAVLTMSLAIAIFFIRKAIDEKDLLQGAQRDNLFLKLRYLRARLNPHFLFNTLNSIYSLSMKKSDQTPEVVVKLADIMRYLIYECDEEKIALNKEIDFIRNYIEIEKVRYKADVRFSVEGETDGIMIEPFLFMSFIENGFKHAMDNSFDEPFIYITLKIANDLITLNVVNSSNVDLETQAKRINGKGLTTSKSLLELLYNDSYSLDIIQTEKEETRTNSLRMRHAKERLEILYPDSYTLDVILNNNSFAVSLIIKSASFDKVYHR
jgi:two-component system LytT family sensor kinase